MNGLSQVCLTQARYDRALAYSQAAASILEETTAQADYAIALYHMGRCHYELDHMARAEQCFEHALVQFHTVDDRERENYSLAYLGKIYAQRQQIWSALACYEAVLDSLATQPFWAEAEPLLAIVLPAIDAICQSA